MKKKDGIVTMTEKEYNKMADQMKLMINLCNTAVAFHDQMSKIYDTEVIILKEALRIVNRKSIKRRKRHTKAFK